MVTRLIRASLIAIAGVASSVAVQADGQWDCRSAENLFHLRHCAAAPRTGGPWQIDFGVKPVPELPPVQTLTHDGWRPANGPHQPQPFSTTGVEGMFMSGLKLIPSPVAPKPANDCAMVRPADPSIDPNFARRVHGHVNHALRIVPVTPCR